MLWGVEDVGGGASFDDLAVAQHHGFGAHAAHHIQVVGDKQQGKPTGFNEFLNQSQDVGLRGGVERCGWLITNKKFRIEGERMAIMTRWRCPPESWCG